MKTRISWRRTEGDVGPVLGWRLFYGEGTHLGTVFVDGSWYCAVAAEADHAAGSQPLAAQALLRAAGVKSEACK